MNRKKKSVVLCVIAVSAWAVVVKPVEAQKPRITEVSKADEDFKFQGEYAGKIKESLHGIQIVALGKGEFQAYVFEGGLPGSGWNGGEKVAIKPKGKLQDGVLSFVGDEHGNGSVKEGLITVTDPDGKKIGELKKVNRKSPTLGQKPPKNGVVLFDGKTVEGWKNGKMTADGLLMQGTTSGKLFGSHKIHIEFLIPYMPQDRGQGRGNSGLYVQGRYEVQMLDSFGLEGKMNECGGIYSVAACDLNMCYPPLSWQTYDIDYTAATYESGKVVSNPRMTVYHNGVIIHNNVELPGNRNTTAAPLKAGPAKGPLYLQNHGCPVRYRNIWVVEK
ncbi:MAG: DUF1080 domain-containing protein [Planctomycetota bacterium]|nr:DUF1080 domain-containing protein [Planctomycetota bacterium]